MHQESVDVCVSSTVENPEAICKFIDYFFSPEGMLAGALGYEGQFFHWTDHEILGTIPVWDVIPEGYASAEEYRYKGSVLNGGFSLHESNLDRVALFQADPEKLYEDSIEAEYGWAALVAQAYNRDGVTLKDTFPNLAYTLEESEERSTLRTDVRNYISQMNAEFITGQTDIDAGWDAYVETCNNMGLTRLLEIEQAAYDRAYK